MTGSRAKGPAAGVLAAIVLAGAAHGHPHADAEAPSPPRNLILFVGDGLGPAYVTLARTFQGAPLALDSLLVGSAGTGSADSHVTDSGASATALACGVLTYNTAIGVDPEKRPRRSILEAAQGAGKATGLVATSRITHATPAAFAAHVKHRDREDEIAEQLLAKRIDVILGGGSRNFVPSEGKLGRKDGRDLLEAARAAGVLVVRDRAALLALPPGAAPLLGLFSSSHMTWVLDRGPEEPSLVEMTRVALERLSTSPRGFFLMVEGSRIDHAGHAHDAATAVHEVLELDAAVALAVEFARRDGGTLVAVTADHETGGLSLGREVGGRSIYDWEPDVLRAVRRSADHIAERVRAGEDPRRVLAEDAGLLDLSEEELAGIASAAGDLEVAVSDAVSRRAVIGWTTHGHTAVDVPVWAFGPGAADLRGARPMEELGRALARAVGLEVGAVLDPSASRSPQPTSSP
ncbi:MAG: alkaline phosphatase [Candidatus Eiseniibacteriota bacterium]